MQAVKTNRISLYFYSSIHDRILSYLMSMNCLKRINEYWDEEQLETWCRDFLTFPQASAMEMFIFLVMKIDEKKEIVAFTCKRHSSFRSCQQTYVRCFWRRFSMTSQMMCTSIIGKWIKVHWKKWSTTMAASDESAYLWKKKKKTKDSHETNGRHKEEKNFVITVVSRQTENSIICIHCSSVWQCLQ